MKQRNWARPFAYLVVLGLWVNFYAIWLWKFSHVTSNTLVLITSLVLASVIAEYLSRGIQAKYEPARQNAMLQPFPGWIFLWGGPMQLLIFHALYHNNLGWKLSGAVAGFCFLVALAVIARKVRQINTVGRSA